MNRQGRTIGALVMIGWLSCLGARSSQAQSEAALRDRARQLVERLDSPDAKTSAAAIESLIKIGPRILPFLPDPATVKNAGLKARLETVRRALEQADARIDDKASLVTLKGKGVRLSEAIAQLQKQSGNAITDMREQLGAEVVNPGLDLDVKDKPFLEALDLVARQAGVGLTFFTGDGTIGLAGGPAMDAPGAAQPAAPVKPMVYYTGPFRIGLKQIGLVRDYQAGGSSANLEFELSWEPRLRPMLLVLKADSVGVLDDRGRSIKPRIAAESTEVVIRPENPIAEINLNLDAPERSAIRLKTLKFKAEITIPAGVKTFTFKKLDLAEAQKQGGVGVSLKSFEVDEQVWKVNVELAYPGEGPAFESYRQGLFNNRVWLLRADGSRFAQNGGFSNTSSDGGKLGFEYLFVDAPGKPGDYGLVYETPSKVVTLPVEFEFHDVDLP